MTSRDPLRDPAPLIRQVYAFVAFHLRSAADAEDVTSEVFERAVRYRDSFDPAKASPATWLIGIARRCIADARLNGHVSLEDAGELAHHEDVESSTIRRLELSDALSTLSPRDRELLAFRYGAGMSTKQIAPLVESTPGAVDVAVHRARERLRVSLEEGVTRPSSERGRTKVEDSLNRRS
jgi:RNA polymerase sigma factor (sigma-70 family)